MQELTGIPFFLIPPFVEGRCTMANPSLEAPTSQLCTVAQMRERHHVEFSRQLGLDPQVLHRKNWEWTYIHRALEVAGMVQPGRHGLCFAVGTEILPSLLASKGVAIHATEGPPEVADIWAESAQYAKDGLESIWKPELIDRTAFDRLVTFEFADMRRIPGHLRGFDFVWSSCSFEHLGSLRAGMDFVLAAMDTIKPGGFAVHTTEFNLTSNESTIEDGATSVYRKRDVDLLIGELEAAGHSVWPFNPFPGIETVDRHVDLPPYALPHLKLRFAEFTITSLGLVVQKAARSAKKGRRSAGYSLPSGWKWH